MLYGRRDECAAIDLLLGQARDGRPGALVLHGEPGIGKTALLEYAADRARDMLVLRASGVESESRLAFAGLHALLRPAFDAIDRLPLHQSTALRGALGLADAAALSQFLISAAVLGLLAELAEDHPVVCLVDDAQWLDAASLGALSFVMRRLEVEPLAFVVAVRDEAAVDMPAALVGVRRVPLPPLDQESVEQLLDDRLDLALDHRLRTAVIAAARGNPLALVELSAENALRGDGRQPAGVSLSTRLEGAFLRRVRALNARTQRFLVLASADDAGELGPLLAAGTALGLHAEDLAAAEQAGLVRVHDAQLSFLHPLVRSAVYQSATFTDRRAAHLALAAAVTEPGRRTWHRAAVAQRPDDVVADALEALGLAAKRRGALPAAADAFARAAELTADSRREGALLVQAAEAAWESGRCADARRILQRVEHLDLDATLRARTDHLRGRLAVYGGVVLDGYEVLVSGARRVSGVDPRRAASMLADAVRGASFSGDLDRVLLAGRMAGDLRIDGEVPYAAAGVAGIAALLGGQPDVAAPLLRSAVRAAEKEEDPRLLVWAGTALAFLGDLGSARSLGVRAVSRSRDKGAVRTLVHALELVSVIELAWAPRMAEADAVEGLRLARESGLVASEAILLATIAGVAALRGDEAGVRRCADEVFVLANDRGLAYAAARAVAALGVLDLGLGRPAEAVARFQQLERSYPHVVASLEAAPDLIEAAIRAGQLDDAKACLVKVEEWAGASGSLGAQAMVARSRALLHEGAAAEDQFRTAMKLGDGHGGTVWLARTQLLYGEFLRRQRRRSEARPLLRTAAETFERLGAAPWAERARSELRATGESARHRDPGHADDLTPQERQIARLVATGATSKEVAAQLFLSPRTVDYHLRKVFVKTGITSRHQLRELQL